MAEPEPMSQLVEFTDNLVVLRWDEEEGCPVYDLGNLDPWSACTLLQQVYDAVYEDLPLPRNTATADDDDD